MHKTLIESITYKAVTGVTMQEATTADVSKESQNGKRG